jgi:hypothetical protein
MRTLRELRGRTDVLVYRGEGGGGGP